jgi:hypothetical protein
MESREDLAQPPEGRAKKVAIIGFAESWKEAPWNDADVEFWCLNEFHKYAPRWHRWFELHDDETLGVTKRDLSEGEQRRHLDWLATNHGPHKPIYMQPTFCDGRFPNAVPLPLEALIQRTGLRYFTSSIGYMIGLALLEEFPWIGLYGIDLASDIEYQQQRANAEYLVGIARGEGRTVVLAKTSAICKAGHLYGYEQPVQDNDIVAALKKHKATLTKQHELKLAELNTLDGAIQATESAIKLHDYKERGCLVQAN